MLTWILRALAISLPVGVLAILALYFVEIREAYARVNGKSTVIASPYGDIEYTEGGAGPAVLVIHGGGGGYDQGELIAEFVLQDRFRWITPSRFGYLRSTYHPGATWDDQARAYAHLLDQLGIERVAVVGFSQGGASALLFAVLYPERVSSLTLLSVGVAQSTVADQAQADEKGSSLVTVFRHDLPFWLMTRFFKSQFMGLMGASDAVIAELTPRQRELLDRTIAYMNPASPRYAGTVFDNQTPLPGARVAAIQAPTVILHATDDLLQLYHNAEFAASAIPGAKLTRFERGGHLLLGVEMAAIRSVVQQHILDNAGGSARSRGD